MVYLRITVNGVRSEISMQRQCSVNDWNYQLKRLKGRTPVAKSFNSYLEAVEFRVYEIYKDMIAEGIQIHSEEIKKRFLCINTERPRMLLEIFDYHNKEFKELVGKDFSIGTFKRFEVCKKSVREFLQWKLQVNESA